MAGREGVGAGLRQIVADYESRGVDLSADPRLAEAILLDSFPDAPAEVRALVEAIRSGAIQYMRDRAAQGAEFSIHGSASQLEDSAGLRGDLARWSVETWWNALALWPAVAGAAAVEAAKVTRPVPPPPPPPAPGGVAVPPAGPAASGEDVTAYSTAAPVEPPPTAGVPPADARQQLHDSGQHHETGQQFPAAPPQYPTGQPTYETDRQPWETAPQQYPAEQHVYQGGPPQYGSGQGSPPHQGPIPPGPSAGKARNTRALVAVGLVVVILVAYAGIAAATHLPPFKAASSTTTTSSPVVTSTPSTSTSTTSSTIPTPTTSAALSQQLFADIPDASTTCVALTAAELKARVPAGAGAAWECEPKSGGLSVLYAIFGSNAAAQAGYQGTLTRVTGGLPSGVCGTKNDVESTYHSNSDPGKTIGTLACYTTGGAQILFWWHYSDHILASASSTTLGVSQMVKDWGNLGPS